MATLEEYRNPEFVKVCDATLEEFMELSTAVTAILLATPDGFTISSFERDKKHNADNLAAVGSTIFALGGSAGEQLELGACSSVTIDNEKGRIYICSIEDNNSDNSLILFIESTQKAMLAQILHSSRKLVETLTKHMNLIG